jgi:hypothetical protein
MTFFDAFPEPPPPPELVRLPRPVWMQPDAVIPGSVPAELVLIRTEQVAVALGSVRAYPNGFEFTLHVRTRGADETEPGWHDPLDRHGQRGQAPGEILLFGLMFADGRRTATTARYSQPDETDPGRLILRQGGGGGNAHRWDGEFWIHPLPPLGPVTFVASWPKFGVSETRAELDGAAIREAAERAVILWPEEPDIVPREAYAWQTVTPDHSNGGAEPDQPGGAEPDQPGAEDPDITP